MLALDKDLNSLAMILFGKQRNVKKKRIAAAVNINEM